jgi:hypothetical protein
MHMYAQDAWHRITECISLRLEKARFKCFRRVAYLISAWESRDPLVRQVDAARHLAALLEVKQHRYTRPGRVFIFLATLAAPLLSAEQASTVGLPPSWAELLVVPLGGSAQVQGETLAMAAVFRGFAALAATVAAGREDDAPPALPASELFEGEVGVERLPPLPLEAPPLPPGPPPVS